MHQTAKIIYRPEGRTEDILMYHIEDFADLAKTSRREIDRMIADDDIEKVKWRGITCIPAEFLNQFTGKETESERPKRGEQQTGGCAAGAETETEPQTPWEELSYEPR